MKVTQELELYLILIRDVDCENNEQFKFLLNRSFELLNLTDGDFTARFACSRPTIERWKSGINAPHPEMRKPIYDFLEKKIMAAQLKLMSQ